LQGLLIKPQELRQVRQQAELVVLLLFELLQQVGKLLDMALLPYIEE
jgi:hypothetical protein